MDPEQITTKAQKLIELAAAQGVVLRFEEAVTLLVLNPGKHTPTLLKLASQQYGKAAQATPQTATATGASKPGSSETSVQNGAESAATALVTVATSGKNSPTLQPKTYRFDRKTIKLLCDTFFAGEKFYAEYEALRCCLISKKEVGLELGINPEDFELMLSADDPLSFFLKLPTKVNAHLAKSVALKRPLTRRELLRTSEAQLMQTLDDFVIKLEAFAQQAKTSTKSVFQNEQPSKPTLTYLDIIRLIEDFCSCLQLERPNFVFLDLIKLLGESYPLLPGELESLYDPYKETWRDKHRFFYFNSKYLVDFASKTCPGAEILAHESLIVGTNFRILQLADEDMFALDEQEYMDARPERHKRFLARWVGAPYYLREYLLERWLENQRKRLEDEKSHTTPQRLAQINVVERASQIRRVHLTKAASTQLAKVFQSSKRTIDFKKKTAKRIFNGYVMSFDPFDPEPNLENLGSVIRLKAAQEWRNLFNDALRWWKDGLLLEWRRLYKKFDFEKANWPSIDGSRIEPKSWDQSLKEAMVQLGYSENDVAF